MAMKWLSMGLLLSASDAEKAIPSQALQLPESAIVLDIGPDTPANFLLAPGLEHPRQMLKGNPRFA